MTYKPVHSKAYNLLVIVVLLGLVVAVPFIAFLAIRILLVGAPVAIIGGLIIFVCQMLDRR